MGENNGKGKQGKVHRLVYQRDPLHRVLYGFGARAVHGEQDPGTVARMRIEYSAERFGPNGAAVVDVMSKVETWDQVTDPARWTAAKAAWYAARDAAHTARHTARYTARHTARDAAWDVARDTAWDVARDVARYTARDAAGYTAIDAAGYAAWDAATAAVVADLVGQHGLTQQHLDALTAPFEAFHNALISEALRGNEGA